MANCNILRFSDFRLLLAGVALLLFVQKAISQPVLVLRDQRESYSLAGHLDFFVDEEPDRSIEEISLDSIGSKFRFYGNRNPQFAVTYDVLWLHFKLLDHAVSSDQWLIEVSYPMVGDLQLFYKNKAGGWHRQRTGADVPFTSRPFEHRKLILPLPAARDSALDAYLRVQSKSSMTFPLKVISQSSLAVEDQWEYFLFGVFNGALILMFLYNLFLYISTREHSYLAYSVYVACYGTYQGIFDGIAQQFLFAHYPYSYAAPTLALLWLTVAASSYFAVIYLRLREDATGWYKLMLGMVIGGIALGVYTFIGDVRFSNRLATSVALVIPIAQLCAGAVRWKRGYTPAKYYVIALIGFLLGASARAFRNLGLLPNTELTLATMQFGILWEFSVLSFGLANRINTVKDEERRERERLRAQIASDLHDEIGSNLSSIAVVSQMMRRHSGVDDTLRQHLNNISETAKRTAETMREIVWFVSPAHQSSTDFLYKFKDTAALLLRGIEYEISLPPEETSFHLSSMQLRNLYLVLKETLHNIMKHAHATHVDIDLSVTKNEIRLRVQDNGDGFDDTTVKGGEGLNSLRRRAADVGGELNISTAPGKGTTILLRIPSGAQHRVGITHIRDSGKNNVSA